MWASKNYVVKKVWVDDQSNGFAYKVNDLLLFTGVGGQKSPKGGFNNHVDKKGWVFGLKFTFYVNVYYIKNVHRG